MSFKGNKVWAQTDESNNLLIHKGKVLIKYKLDQDYEYTVKPENLKAAIPANLTSASTGKNNKNAVQIAEAITPASSIDSSKAIIVYTDGASSGNPGPSGIGVYLQFGKHEKKISQYIGISTNNIAELSAIKTALTEIKNRELPVIIHTDSSYALGLLSKNWKPKKNQELVASIKSIMKEFKTIAFEKVKGHSGIKGNEIADQLAVEGIKKGSDQ
jgi:ribonuclease HI